MLKEIERAGQKSIFWSDEKVFTVQKGDPRCTLSSKFNLFLDLGIFILGTFRYVSSGEACLTIKVLPRTMKMTDGGGGENKGIGV